MRLIRCDSGTDSYSLDERRWAEQTWMQICCIKCVFYPGGSKISRDFFVSGRESGDVLIKPAAGILSPADYIKTGGSDNEDENKAGSIDGNVWSSGGSSDAV